MRFFDKTSSVVLSFYGLVLLFLPKINFFSASEEQTAGVRIDDVILLFLFIVVFWAHLSMHKAISRVERYVFLFTIFCLLSFLINRLLFAEHQLFVQANIFYAVRLLEYFVFFYIGMMSIHFFRPSQVLMALFIWSSLWFLLQKTGLVGKFGVQGYASKATVRVTGIASFPAEGGALINMLFCYFLFTATNIANKFRWFPGFLRVFMQQTWYYWLFMLSAILIAWTEARIALVALFVPFVFFLVKELRKGGFLRYLYFGLFFLLFLSSVVWFVHSVSEKNRFVNTESLLTIDNLQLTFLVWQETKVGLKTKGITPVVSFSEKEHDLSWWERIHKWCFAMKTYITNPWCYLQGVGPGFASAALDGGWLRLLTECGVIGSLLFVKVISTIARQGVQLKWMLVALGINMIFFDVYLAYKLMSLLFFVSGCVYAEACEESRRDISYQEIEIAEQ